MHNYSVDRSMTMREAGRIWLDQHSSYIKTSTVRGYAFALRVLERFFGEMKLEEIAIEHIRQFQHERKVKAGAYRINNEVSTLQQILKEARLWKEIDDLYRPMPVPKRCAGHSLSAEQEQRLREVALSRPKWQLAGHCMIVMLSTTMGFGELRRLRRCDVDMEKRSVTVREGAKNEHRERTIPLNSAAYEGMVWILKRWAKLGGSRSEHYILPHRPRGKGQPWLLHEPATAIRTAFRQIRLAAGLPYFRVHDCRVQAITKLLSNPAVSPQVSKEIAGHISQAMQDRYSIQQFDTKKAALDALESFASPQVATIPPLPQSVPEPHPLPRNVIAFRARAAAN